MQAQAANLDTIVAAWASAAAPSLPPVPVRSARALAAYEGGAHTRRTLGWRAPTVSANAALLRDLHTLRARSRHAVRNDGYAKGAIDKLVTNAIGTGIKPLSQAEDPELRTALQALWLRWTDESDADGLLDFYGQQAQAVRAMLEGGEVFVRLRDRRPGDGLSVPLQLQVLEPELCPHTHSTMRPNGNRIEAGIEFDRLGRRVAYWFHPSRPADFGFADFDAGRLRRIPADKIVHLYEPLRPGQLRGMPHLTQALIRLHELDKFDDATLLRQQLANLYVAFLTKPASFGDGEALHPLTGLPIETHGDAQTLTLEPGIWQELGPGEDVTFSDPPDVKSGYADFIRQQLYHVSAATGVPYETLTGDMSKVNDRTVRVLLQDFRRRVMELQHNTVVFQLCRPVWRAWMERVFLSGALSLPADFLQDPEPWVKTKWTPQGWPYLHPVQDVQAEEKAIRSGFTSRSAAVSERGEDAEVIDREQAEDNARADELGLKYDSDGRNGNGSCGDSTAADIDEEEDDKVPESQKDEEAA